LVVNDLGVHIKADPSLAALLWNTIERIEERVVVAPASSQVLRNDIGRLLNAYNVFSRPERVQSLLKKTLQRGSLNVYAQILTESARDFPEGVKDLSSLDVELLVESVEGAAGGDRVLAELLKLTPGGDAKAAGFAAHAVKSRAETAAAYSRLLLSAGKTDAAARVMRAAIAGTSCDRVLGAMAGPEQSSLTDIVCRHCATSAVCSKQVLNPGNTNSAPSPTQ